MQACDEIIHHRIVAVDHHDARLVSFGRGLTCPRQYLLMILQGWWRGNWRIAMRLFVWISLKNTQSEAV